MTPCPCQLPQLFRCLLTPMNNNVQAFCACVPRCMQQARRPDERLHDNNLLKNVHMTCSHGFGPKHLRSDLVQEEDAQVTLTNQVSQAGPREASSSHTHARGQHSCAHAAGQEPCHRAGCGCGCTHACCSTHHGDGCPQACCQSRGCQAPCRCRASAKHIFGCQSVLLAQLPAALLPDLALPGPLKQVCPQKTRRAVSMQACHSRSQPCCQSQNCQAPCKGPLQGPR